MRKRYLFSGATNFALFDFVNPEGNVDENVFAYTNRAMDERALIIYNNAYTTTRGVLHTSTAINVGCAEEQQLQRRILVDALALNTDPRYYAILHDMRTGLEYLRHTATMAEAGFHVELHAYEYKAFVSIRQVCDYDRSWGRLHAMLGDRGVPDMYEAYLEMYLSDILNPFRALMTPDMITHLITTNDSEDILGPWRTKMLVFLKAVCNFTDQRQDTNILLEEINKELLRMRAFISAPDFRALPEPVRTYLTTPLPEKDCSPEELVRCWRPFIIFCLLRPLGKIAHFDSSMETVEAQSAAWMRAWMLTKHIGRAFAEIDANTWQGQQDARLAYACMSKRFRFTVLETDIWGPALYEIFEDDDVKALLQMNIFSGRRWINKESLERLLHALLLMETATCKKDASSKKILINCYANIQDILNAASDTGYDFDWMLASLK